MRLTEVAIGMAEVTRSLTTSMARPHEISGEAEVESWIIKRKSARTSHLC